PTAPGMAPARVDAARHAGRFSCRVAHPFSATNASNPPAVILTNRLMTLSPLAVGDSPVPSTKSDSKGAMTIKLSCDLLLDGHSTEPSLPALSATPRGGFFWARDALASHAGGGKSNIGAASRAAVSARERPAMSRIARLLAADGRAVREPSP